MKPSELKKDDQAPIRINKVVKARLKAMGMSAQVIVDAYIDNVLTVDLEVVEKWRKKAKGGKRGKRK